MLVTPSTANVHGGTGRPSRAAYGSTQPPMHASTWQRTPRSAAAAAISVTGSTTPWAYDGALATTSTVRSSIAAAIAPAWARKSAPTGDQHRPRRRSSARPCGTPRAPCSGSTIRGRSMSGRASRAPCTASSTDSVPAGGDRADRTGSGASSSRAAKPTSSFSIAQQARERRRVEPVGAGVRRDRLAAHPVGLVEAGVVDVGQRAAAGARGRRRRCISRSRRRTSLIGRRLLEVLAEVEGVARQRHQAEQHQRAGISEKPSTMAVTRRAGLGTRAESGVEVGGAVAAQRQHQGVDRRPQGEPERLAGGPDAGVDPGPVRSRCAARPRPRRRAASPAGRPGRRRTRPRPAPSRRRPTTTAPTGTSSEQQGGQGQHERGRDVAALLAERAARARSTPGSAAAPDRRSRRTGSSPRTCRPAPSARRSRRRPASPRSRAPGSRTWSAAAGSRAPRRRSAAARAAIRRPRRRRPIGAGRVPT